MNETTRSPKQMIEEALAIAPENNYEAAELLGVTEGTVRSWRSGDYPQRLRADTRKSLEIFLEGAQRGEAGVVLLGGADADALRSLWARLDAIDARADLTPLQREMRQERELAAYRTAILEQETRAAGRRTRVIEAEGDRSDERVQRIGVPATVERGRKVAIDRAKARKDAAPKRRRRTGGG